MRRIVAASLRFRSIIIAMAAALMIVGGAQLSSASVDVFPEFAPPRVEVQTACLGLTASEVEELVTVPMEQAFNGIDGLDQMRSKSVSQLSADRDGVQARDRSAHRPAAGVGADGNGHTDPADLGRAAGDAPAAVLHQPGHEDRALVRTRLA